MRTLALSLAFAPLSPLLLLQGRRVRRDTPRLPPAAGPCGGVHAGRDAGPPLRLLAVGESTVAGVGARTHAEALTGQLAGALSDLSGRAVAWRAFGLSGATVKEAHASLLPAMGDEPADLMLLAFGVNDVLAHTVPRRYADALSSLIDALRAKAGGAPVLIAGAPPMARFPSLPRPLNSYLGARAALLDRAVAGRAIERAVQVAPQVRIEPELFAADRFHPSPAGYRVWAQVLAQVAGRQGFIQPSARVA